jgi:hypothetical protein
MNWALELSGSRHPAAEIESAVIYRSNEFASWALEEETAAAERVLLKRKSVPIVVRTASARALSKSDFTLAINQPPCADCSHHTNDD